MKRMNILNLKIEAKCQKEQNNNLIKKLKTAKPLINIKCPESYTFFKTKFHKNGPPKNLCKSYYKLQLYNI